METKHWGWLLLLLLVATACRKNHKSPSRLQVSTTQLQYTAAFDQTDSFYIESDTDWELSVGPGVDWITTDKTNGTDDGKVKVTITKEYAGLTARTAEITIRAVNNSVAPIKVTIEQRAYAVSIQMQKTRGALSGDYLLGMVKAPDNSGYVAVGYSWSNEGEVPGNKGLKDVWVVKTNNDGNLVWSYGLGSVSSDEAYSVISTSGGGYLVTGTAAGSDPDFAAAGYKAGIDIFALKLDANGNKEWLKCYGGTSTEFGKGGAVQTADGSFIISGYTYSNDGDVSGNHSLDADFWIVKISSTGVLQWQKCYGGTGAEEPYGIVMAQDGNILIAGTTVSTNGDVTGLHGLRDIWVIKLNETNGNAIWKRCYGGSLTEFVDGHPLCLSSDGGFFVTGVTTSDNSGDVTGNSFGGEDIWVLKLSESGSLIWQRRLGGTLMDESFAVTGTPDGGCVLTGDVNSTSGDITGHHGQTDVWVAKLDRNGNKMWTKALGGAQYDHSRAIIRSGDGSFMIGGFTDSNDQEVSGNHGNTDFWLVKLKVE